MKKYLPFILLGVGLLVVFLVFLFIKKSSNKGNETQDEVAAEIPFDKRPFASLTPSEDGHWLKLHVEKLLEGAKSIDYELLYTLPDGRTQGVPGSVSLSGITFLDRDLLLGSESSGKFRYDEGVNKGTLTLRFRDDKGKLMGKVSTDFALLSDTSHLSSVDGGFTYKLDKAPKAGFFVVMQTFGISKDLAGATGAPNGVFTSEKGVFPGTVNMMGDNINYFKDGSWIKLQNGSSPDIGVFIASS